MAAFTASVLVPLAGGLGEAAGLPGVELDGWQAGFVQGALKCAVIGAGGLEQDPRWLLWPRPCDQRRDGGLVIAEASVEAGGQQMDVELLLGDVDADDDRRIVGGYSPARLFRVPCLPSRAVNPDYPFGPGGKERGDQTPIGPV